MSSSSSEADSSISHRAEPASRNPFLTPEGNLRVEERDIPPHLAAGPRRLAPPFSRVRLLSPSTGTPVSDDDPLPDTLLPLPPNNHAHTPSFDDVYGTGTGAPTQRPQANAPTCNTRAERNPTWVTGETRWPDSTCL